jgi:hypothetical protein
MLFLNMSVPKEVEFNEIFVFFLRVWRFLKEFIFLETVEVRGKVQGRSDLWARQGHNSPQII